MSHSVLYNSRKSAPRSLNGELFILWPQAHSISHHISITDWQQLTSSALWTVINHWHETYCCLYHILCQLKRLPNIFSWHAGKSCKDLRGNDDKRKAWPKRKVQMLGNGKWGTCHWYLQPHLPLQVPICSSTGPSTDRCLCKREGCWGVKEAINIVFAQVPLSTSNHTTLSFTLTLHLSSLTCPSLLLVSDSDQGHLKLMENR